jgi:hypothetical protein
MTEISETANGQDGERPRAYFDLDGFFRPMTEMGAISPKEVLSSLPTSVSELRKALILHSLFRSSMVLTNEVNSPEDAANLRYWSEICVLYSIIGAKRGFLPSSPEWLTFYSDDLHRHFLAKHGVAQNSTLELTLDERLVAWSNPNRGQVSVSAITREYLLRINVYLANLVNFAVSGDKITEEDSMEFFNYVMHYLVRLHREANPSRVPVARPSTLDTFAFALRITQIQMEFLIAHEFGHLVLNFPPGTRHSKQEVDCDSFAYQCLAEFEREARERFLAVRWLFELLAFDRVLAQCLAFRGGNWDADVDWLQLDFRERRRLEEILRNQQAANSALSRHENFGSLLLLDLKGNLYKLGWQGVNDLIKSIVDREPSPPPEKFAIIAMNILKNRLMEDQ